MALAMRSKLVLVAAMMVPGCGDDQAESVAGSTDTGADTSVPDDGWYTSADDGVYTTYDDGPYTTSYDDGPYTTSYDDGPYSTSWDDVTTDWSEVSTSIDPSDTSSVTTDEPGTTTTGSPTTDATTTDATTTDATTTTGDPTDTDTTTGGGVFPDPPPFGQNVLDLDLVGTWNLNWDPQTGFDSVLDIDDAGNFTWTETSADCSTSTVASGFLWVSGSQIVMHVEEWERPLPWDTMAVLGETFPPPFRLLMSFSLQGNGGTAYLALGAPPTITETTPYTGESHIRLTTDGVYLGGTWRGEAELQAIPQGETEPVTIVRDVYQALLDAETDVMDPEGTGVRAVTTTYFPVPQQSTVFDGGNWTCLGGCPALAGTTLIDGSNLYTYGPYGGQTHLLTFATGRTFKRDVPSDCS
jgi:hypothetical protein